ncbi:MAG: dihydropteroate synthase [Thermacetogeniaceae bacterium]|jgi:5-methyltetrahydrofolate--homocysteine methyltransferase|nr:dihydropteroate synthase [Syntrophomonadaceae bacterium]
MLIIGEKLNSTIPAVRRAIEEKDVKYIQELAVKQCEAGADFIDVNTAMCDEVPDMEWMVRIIQEVVDVPLCIDSTNPAAIEKGLQVHKGKPMINSISMEKYRLEGILPLIKEHDCSVVALTTDDSGIPDTVEDRVRIAGELIDILEKNNVDRSDIYVDPLVLPVAVKTDNAVKFFQSIEEIKQHYNVKIISGLSNVSHSLPKRKVINKYFLTICMSKGMDAAIMDPLDGSIMTALLATNLLLNKDRICQKYLTAYRNELIQD